MNTEIDSGFSVPQNVSLPPGIGENLSFLNPLFANLMT